MRFSLLLILAGLMVLPDAAQGACAVRDFIVSELADRYQEQPVAQAVTKEGELLEVLTSKDGARWTLLITRPTGLTCTLIEGKDWESLSPKLVLNQLAK